MYLRGGRNDHRQGRGGHAAGDLGAMRHPVRAGRAGHVGDAKLCFALAERCGRALAKQRNLLAAAQVAVEYVEGVVGRFNGEEKLQLALTIMESRGWVKSDEVLQALKAKWVELDLQQIAAGVKEVVGGTGGTES